MAASQPSLIQIYARNVEHHAFMRGWPPPKLATELGVTHNTLTRIRFARSRYIDPDVFSELLRVFGCTPNDLLLPFPGIDYSSEIHPR